MIVTLTPNPSLDRTVTLAAPLERGAVQRAESVISQAGGKGVNISRAVGVRGHPLVRGAARAQGRPVRPRAARRRHRLPRGAQRGRASGQHHHHRAGRHHHQAEQPRAGGHRGGADRPHRGAAPPGRHRRLDRAGRLAAAGRARRVVRRPGRHPARVRRPARRRHQRRPAAGPGRAAAGERPAPDEAERRGARVVHRRRPRPARVRPRGGRQGRARRSSSAASRPCWPRSARTAPCSSPRNGAWHATPPPTTVVSTVGAGDSSLFGYLLGDIRQRTPDQRLALAVAYGSAAAGLPGTTIPHPSQVKPELVSVRDLTITQGG